MDNQNTSITKVFGERTKFLRLNSGLSQAELSERIGISQAYLSSIERGKKFPTSEVIESIARVLEVEFYEMFLTPGLGVPDQYKIDEFISALKTGVEQVALSYLKLRE